MKTGSTLNAWILIVACILACFCLALSVHATTEKRARVRHDQLRAAPDSCGGTDRSAILKNQRKQKGMRSRGGINE